MVRTHSHLSSRSAYLDAMASADNTTDWKYDSFRDGPMTDVSLDTARLYAVNREVCDRLDEVGC